MTARIWCDPYSSASDLTDTTLFQSFKPAKNIVLRAIRTWVVFIGDPTFTDLNMKLYSNDNENGGPKVLLHTSTDSRTKSELLTTHPHGYKETYFTFDDVSLQSGTTYNLVLNGTGYSSPSDSSFVAWRRAFPDPVYRTGLTLTFENLYGYPYFITAFGAEF